jgi:hypothetical protein
MLQVYTDIPKFAQEQSITGQSAIESRGDCIVDRPVHEPASGSLLVIMMLGKTAQLVTNMQLCFKSMTSTAQINNIKSLVSLFQESEAPVIFT